MYRELNNVILNVKQKILRTNSQWNIKITDKSKEKENDNWSSIPSQRIIFIENG